MVVASGQQTICEVGGVEQAELSTVREDVRFLDPMG